MGERDICVREGRDDDSEGLIRLVGACFDEYPGCVLAVDEEMPYLRAIATYYGERGGRFWTAAQNGEVVGSIGTHESAHDPDTMELRTLYVWPDVRRSGLGNELCDRVEAEARKRGARAVELWSDTRFESAHRLYERRGYHRGGETRALHDLSHTIEYYYRKELAD